MVEEAYESWIRESPESHEGRIERRGDAGRHLAVV